MTEIVIRAEKEGDRETIFAINATAFETEAEAKLVDVLHQQADPIVSLVAEMGGKVVGHILFSPVSLSEHEEVKIMGLAPMAVLESHQRGGVGSSLVREGMAQCEKLDCQAVVVLGHPGYYPKFGFVPAHTFGIDCEYDVPANAFLVKELEPDSLGNKSGRIHYHKAFSDL